ncbi:MAG: hypothetical protein ACFFDN_24080 [Candidatus Hodarchaeota archaeon]
MRKRLYIIGYLNIVSIILIAISFITAILYEMSWLPLLLYICVVFICLETSYMAFTGKTKKTGIIKEEYVAILLTHLTAGFSISIGFFLLSIFYSIDLDVLIKVLLILPLFLCGIFNIIARIIYRKNVYQKEIKKRRDNTKKAIIQSSLLYLITTWIITCIGIISMVAYSIYYLAPRGIGPTDIISGTFDKYLIEKIIFFIFFSLFVLGLILTFYSFSLYPKNSKYFPYLIIAFFILYIIFVVFIIPAIIILFG